MLKNERPFLKWAGGKNRIADEIKKVLPDGKRLIEPFVGSAAIFINTHYPRYLLADSNPDLINVYKQLKKHKEDFITYVAEFFIPQNNRKNKYYKLRKLFNTTQDQALKAALFIYLNRHGYNGLCRYNSDGEFNVPFGQYDKPYMPMKPMQAFYKKARNVTFSHADFVITMRKAKPGDVIYCDPPYAPISKTARFTRYSIEEFTLADQIKLNDEAISAAKRGVPVIISNHHTKFTKELYKNAKIIKLDVPRMISCNSTNRNKVKEVIAIYDFRLIKKVIV